MPSPAPEKILPALLMPPTKMDSETLMPVACELIEPVLLLVMPPAQFRAKKHPSESVPEVLVPLLVIPPVNVETLAYIPLYCAWIEPLLVIPPPKLDAKISMAVSSCALIEPLLLMPPR